jgi:hypothetical protein
MSTGAAELVLAMIPVGKATARLIADRDELDVGGWG